MVQKSKIYTKTGDKGETALLGGTRLSKGSAQIELYGEVDELNSFIGHAKTIINDGVKFKEDCALIVKIQSALFDLGSHLACEETKREDFNLPKVNDSLVREIEERIDVCDASCPPLKNFILPGGSLGSSSLHIARTVCRRVERSMLRAEVQMPENALRFINRLSDYFFVLARYVNLESGVNETLWIASNGE